MKKRIFVFAHWMEIGGAEISLLGLLENIDYTKYEVDLFLCRHSGELMKLIPESVNVIPESSIMAAIAKPIKKLIKNPKMWGVIAVRIIAKILTSIYYLFHCNESEKNAELAYVHKLMLPLSPKINNPKYDLAISFLAPHYFTWYKVKASHKVAWIHTDYSKISINVNLEKKIWNKFEYIVSISDECTRSFTNKFGIIDDNLILIENILPQSYVVSKSNEVIKTSTLSENYINILSVGRFCKPKNFDNIPFICKKILESGLNVKWYLIGFGSDEELIRSKIAEAGMQKYVIILGKKSNPYPYMKACDVYVQPSRYEGKAVTVREAQMLGKPVVITKYATSASQLEDGVDGIIVPMDNDGCAAGIVNVLQNKELMKNLSENCKNRDYSNSSEINKIYKLMDE